MASSENEETRFATDRLGGGVFVGRERELAELRSALAEAERGRGSFFLLSGEPGIGKTRLADRLCGIAAGAGFQVVWGRAWEGEGAPAFWPWVQVIRSLAETTRPTELAEQTGSGAAYLVRIVPELREKLPSVPTAATSPESEHARFYLFDATARFLKKAAQSRPLVLVLDDLHWADKPSLLLLEFVAREVADARILLIGTYREVEARQEGPLSDALAALARQARPLPLRGLGEAEVRALMEAIGKGAPDPRLVTAVRRASDGNPFFVDEIVRLLAAEGITQHTSQRPLPIPDSVRAVIRRRLATLPPESRSVFAAASAIGGEFDVRLLERVSGRPANELVEILGRGTTAGIVTRAPGPLGRYGFAHALISETVYDDLSPSERPELHAAIGRALEEVAGADVDSRLAELAYHFLHSALDADVEKAIDYSTRAGRRAMEMHAYEEAAGHFARGLQAQSLRHDERRRCELSILLGEAQSRAGDVKRSLDTLGKAVELAERLHLPAELARAALLFGSSLGTDLARMALLEKALAALPETDSLLRARVLSRLAVSLVYEGSRAERGIELIDEAVEMARRLGDKLTLAQALTMWTLVQWLSPAVAGRGLPSPEHSRLVEETGDKELRIELQCVRIRALLTRGDVASAKREIDTWGRMAEELREPVYLTVAELLRASLDLLEGRFEEAECRLLHARGEARRSGFLPGRQAVGTHLFILRKLQGRLAEIAEEVGRSGWLFPGGGAPGFWASHALALAETGREPEARRLFEGLAEKEFTDIPRGAPGWFIGLAHLSELCALLGDTAHAPLLYELLLRLEGEGNIIAASGASPVLYGAIPHYRGLLATTMSRFDDAERHFEAALALYGRMGAVPWTAQTRYDYARMLLARGTAADREKALRLLQEALATAAELGMSSLLKRARALIDEAGGASEVAAPVATEARPGFAAASEGTVTLMFSDVEGFTEMTERLGDRRAHEVMRDHNAIVREQLKAHGGQELELLGDGFLLAFARAGLAVDCAVAIQKAFAGYSAEHPEHPIRVRIGLHTGEPVREADRFFGKSVIMAARIAAQAKGGEILVSAVVKDLCEGTGEVRFDSGREVELKGLSGKRRVFRVMWGEEEASSRPVREALAPSDANVFRNEGDYWTIAYDGKAFRLRDAKGLGYLAELLRNPGRELSALDLVAGGQEAGQAGSVGAAVSAGCAKVSADLGDAGEVLDTQARADYRRRLEDLREELAEAERFNDPARATKLREEVDFLTNELARATGLGGKSRKAASAAERARLNVTMAIKSAVKRIADNSPSLGRHLAATVKTGRFCSYTPDPESPVRWTL